MKLKKACKIARKLGYNWVYVSYNGTIFASKELPYIETYDNGLYESLDWNIYPKFIGMYTGGKWWTKTLRIL